MFLLSEDAIEKDEEIFSYIRKEADAETMLLAELKGECPDMEGTGRRNSHLLAIAPNANSSIICGTSPSIEPQKANAYTHRTRAGSHLVKNQYLENELIRVGQNTDEVWSSIITTGGSVQHLEFLDEHTKNVFKTAIEIDQSHVVKLAGNRQKHLCQGQSLNIFFPAGASKAYLHNVHFEAWRYGCKGLYYLRTEATNRAENVAEKVHRVALSESLNNKDESQEECLACQG